MATDNKFLKKLNSAINKISEALTTPSDKHNIDPNYKIKYDGSDKELQLLGLITEWGQVIDREGHNKYMAIAQQREDIRKLPYFEILKKQGIVSESGEILDTKKFTEFQIKHSVINNKENMM